MASQSEVIRAIVSDYSPCCGVTGRRAPSATLAVFDPDCRGTLTPRLQPLNNFPKQPSYCPKYYDKMPALSR